MAAEPPEDGGRFAWIRNTWNKLTSPQKGGQEDPAPAVATPVAAQKVRSIQNPRLFLARNADRLRLVMGCVRSRSRDYLQRYPRPPSPARPPRV